MGQKTEMNNNISDIDYDFRLLEIGTTLKLYLENTKTETNNNIFDIDYGFRLLEIWKTLKLYLENIHKDRD